jgi:hypothetical protein
MQNPSFFVAYLGQPLVTGALDGGARSLAFRMTRQTPLKYFARRRVSLTAFIGAESTITRS